MTDRDSRQEDAERAAETSGRAKQDEQDSAKLETIAAGADEDGQVDSSGVTGPTTFKTERDEGGLGNQTGGSQLDGTVGAEEEDEDDGDGDGDDTGDDDDSKPKVSLSAKP